MISFPLPLAVQRLNFLNFLLFSWLRTVFFRISCWTVHLFLLELYSYRKVDYQRKTRTTFRTLFLTSRPCRWMQKRQGHTNTNKRQQPARGKRENWLATNQGLIAGGHYNSNSCSSTPAKIAFNSCCGPQ